jgi:hypothetical protein
MSRTLYFNKLLILTWSKPYYHLKQLYPTVENLLIIGNWSYSQTMPSQARRESTKIAWRAAFPHIEELDVEDEALEEKIDNILFSSNKDWLMLSTGEFIVEKQIAKRLGLPLYNGAHVLLESMEEVY